jgi:hypothetical protein
LPSHVREYNQRERERDFGKKKFLEEGSSYIYIYIDFILRTGREREREREKELRVYDIAK